ncbi:hypothetical protein ACET3X_007210 [Alternaria dauci]|uniref:Ankyrin repeat protein n=1 Tax=Alternaria dauci TaxID=48095 RepID=A0ABR3UIG6_9PLEO
MNNRSSDLLITLKNSLSISKDPLLRYLESSYDCHDLQYPPDGTDFPYLKLTTIGQQEESRKQHKKLQNYLKPYDFLLRFHHLAHTLDESYYPGLSPEALRERNHDQVVSHSTDTFDTYNERDGKNESIDKNAFVLMVPQLWLYRLGNVVVSAFPQPEGSDYLYESLTNEETGPEKNLWQQDANLSLGFIINTFIEGFGKSYTQGSLEYPPTLDLFETRVVSLLSEVSDYVKTRPGENSDFGGSEYHRERYFMHVISDVRSELAMIKHVLEQQRRVLGSFLEECGQEDDGRFSQRWNQVMSMPEKVNKYTERVTKIDDDAGRIEKTIQDMLNLKRTYASIRETHNSLILSTAVIGFTVITIVFTPLAFLTALFALKIEGLEKLQVPSGDGTYHKGKISGIFGKWISISPTNATKPVLLD